MKKELLAILNAQTQDKKEKRDLLRSNANNKNLTPQGYDNYKNALYSEFLSSSELRKSKALNLVDREMKRIEESRAHYVSIHMKDAGFQTSLTNAVTALKTTEIQPYVFAGIAQAFKYDDLALEMIRAAANEKAENASLVGLLPKTGKEELEYLNKLREYVGTSFNPNALFDGDRRSEFTAAAVEEKISRESSSDK